MNVPSVILYAKDAKDVIRVWEIHAENWTIIMQHGQYQGEIQEKTEHIEYGIGGRTRDEQLLSRIKSRINKKKDLGYTERLEDAKLGRTNSLNLLRPMLAQEISKVRNVNLDGCYMQNKYDGHRCLINLRPDGLRAYSRNGKIINSISHVLKHINIPMGCTLDGELYHHGTPLQTISSWVRKDQEASKELSYICYDMISDAPFRVRLSMLSNMIEENDSLCIAATQKLFKFDPLDIEIFLDQAIKHGYEGLILRTDDTGYESGKRSKSLIKVKKFLDDEFLINDIELSKDGLPVLICQTKDKKKFKVVAPGTMGEKQIVFENSWIYIGEMINIKYANLTKDGIPFHPVATTLRNKNDE